MRAGGAGAMDVAVSAGDVVVAVVKGGEMEVSVLKTQGARLLWPACLRVTAERAPRPRAPLHCCCARVLVCVWHARLHASPHQACTCMHACGHACTALHIVADLVGHANARRHAHLHVAP